jgi:hypothetical protein
MKLSGISFLQIILLQNMDRKIIKDNLRQFNYSPIPFEIRSKKEIWSKTGSTD